MSTPNDRIDDPFSLSLDAAARWASTVRSGPSSEGAPGSAPKPSQNENRTPRLDADDVDPAIRRLRTRRSLDPDVPPPPPAAVRKKSAVALVSRLVLVVLGAAFIAYFAISLDSSPRPKGDRGIELASSALRPTAPVAAPSRVEPVLPRLNVQETRLTMGEPAPLGITLQGQAEGAIVMITGLAPGMTLSAGGAVGADAWQVPASELAKAWIVPPANFTGVAALVAELRLADDTVADRRSIYLESVAPVAAAPPPPQMDAEEIAILRKRGEDFLANGDLAAARVVLQRAAEARDAQAALVLAATYDPVVLQQMKVVGVRGDVALARSWYEKAKEYGSPEAPRRLELLAKAPTEEKGR